MSGRDDQRDPAATERQARPAGWLDPQPREWLPRGWRALRSALGRTWSAVARDWTAPARRPRPPSPRVGGLSASTWVLLALVAGLAVRLYYWGIKAGMHYPDEIFQYLEPAWWRIHGYAWLPWEYARGVRNWVLPAYWGGLIEVGEALGFEGWGLHRFLTLHNVFFSLLIIPAGYRLGVAVGRGDRRLGVLTAWAMALFPVFGYFAPHTLSEVHSLVFTTWAYALWMELVAFPERAAGTRRAALVGLLLGGALISRYTLLIAVPLVWLDFNFRARFRHLIACVAGFAVALAVLGLVDAVTWGKPLHSLIEYVKYNLIENGAADHGVSPPGFYWAEAFVQRLGPGLWLLLVPAALAFWRHWRMILAWVIPFLAFSAIGHKEERFILFIWPFVLVAGLSGALALADLLRHVVPLRRWRLGAALRPALAALVLGVVCVAAVGGVAKLPMRWKAGIFRAQSWIGERSDATGVLLDDRIHLNGGYTLLHRNIPQLPFDGQLARRRIFNYVAVYEPRSIATVERIGDFEEVAAFEDVHVFRRTDGLVGE